MNTQSSTGKSPCACNVHVSALTYKTNIQQFWMKISNSRKGDMLCCLTTHTYRCITDSCKYKHHHQQTATKVQHQVHIQRGNKKKPQIKCVQSQTVQDSLIWWDAEADPIILSPSPWQGPSSYPLQHDLPSFCIVLMQHIGWKTLTSTIIPTKVTP